LPVTAGRRLELPDFSSFQPLAQGRLTLLKKIATKDFS
jgi:hypothetical protein